MTNGVFTGPDLHRLMFGLLYPAVLGSFFFLLLPVLFGTRPEASERLPFGKVIAGCLVVFHFIVDFHLTSLLPAVEYSRVGFFVDLMILVALFRAFDSLNISRPAKLLSVPWVAAAMALTYALFLIWSFFILDHIPGRQRLLVVEVIGVILFIVVATRKSVLFLCVSLFIMSTTMAIVGSPVVGSLRDAISASEAVEAFPTGRAPNRVGGGFSPPPPTPPSMRVRTGRFTEDS